MNPRGDHLPPSPVDWQDIPLGPGQEPQHNNAHFQWTPQLPKPDDHRREPGYESFIVVGRWPERWV